MSPELVTINVTNKASDFRQAKDKLVLILGDVNRVQKVNPMGSWSPFYIFDEMGNRTGPYTWHHAEDAETMVPVLKSVHDEISGFRHTGGGAIYDNWRSLVKFFTQTTPS